jgi:hypothetical protein
MRIGLVVLCLALVLAGSGCKSVQNARYFFPEDDPSAETSSGVDVPADDRALPRADAAGLTPEAITLQLIDALNAGDWDTAYSMYDAPPVDLETAAREWSEVGESYTRVSILETRVTDVDTAFVRLSYAVAATASGLFVTMTVSEPGEWWQLQRVDGVWKVQWRPQQWQWQ